MDLERKSGILLHPTSLPGKFGIGDLGIEAYHFVDFLSSAGQKLWQVFPLGPTGYGDSPYQCFSAFAGNPLLISLEELMKEGLLDARDLIIRKAFDIDSVDYGRVIGYKEELLRKAFYNFKKRAYHTGIEDFNEFCKIQASWLDDYALFMSLKGLFCGKPWGQWDIGIKFREKKSIEKQRKELKEVIKYHKFNQFLFFKQWKTLKDYADKSGIEIIGDVPIFTAYDSADCWANPELFYLDKDLNPIDVAGVPPDYFSATGQLWGNPLYDWKKMKKDKYKWWIKRLQMALKMVNYVRLDHFRGFSAYWSVPFGEKTAEKGKWVTGPGKDLFIKMEKVLGELPIIAEDLGVITQDVQELRDEFNYPGMKILQFAFDSKEGNEYLPHHFVKNCVVYTGTHDNDTTLGWYKQLNKKDSAYLNEYIPINGKDISWDLIRLGWASVAKFAIAPLQDILGLDSEARMNVPGTPSGNWKWRFRKNMLNDKLAERLKKITRLYER